MTETLEDRVTAQIDWMITEALSAGLDDYTVIYSQFWDRIYESGLPILRVHAAMQTLHPLMNAIALTWYRGEETAIHTYKTDDGNDSIAWQQNPLKVLIDTNQPFGRHRLPATAEIAERHPLLQEFADKGATDYLGFVIRLAPGEIGLVRQGGMIASITTDQDGGFTDAQLSLIKRIMPRFALVAKLSGRERLFNNVLDSYFGPDSGRRVRDGQISLGSGQLINAVIWFSDLRNSTPLAEKLGHERFMALLNDYFAALAGAVMDHGGDVLRFIGDAALAIFPIADDAFSEREAREHAIAAAKDAIGRAADINAVRRQHGDEPFDYGIGLHAGEIMYGNIGVPTRVEFSVIGAAANEAARIEGLCKTLDEPVLVSQSFIEGMNAEWRDLGDHAIRGSQHPVRLYGLTS